MYRLAIKGTMRVGLTEVASFTKILGEDVSMSDAVDRTVELLSGGYKGHAISTRHSQSIEVGSPAMNVRIVLSMTDGTDAGNVRFQFNREVMDRLTLEGKLFREGILTG